MDLGLLEVDLNENIVYANDAFCSLSGYSKKELIGQNARALLLDQKDDYQNVADENNDKRLEGESSVYEIRIRRKDGKQIWIMISGSPILDDQGKVIGSIGIHYDITEKKNRELKEKHLILSLEARTSELTQNRDFLQAVNEFVTDMMIPTSIHGIVEVITSDVLEKFNFEDCVVYLLDESKENLYQVSAYGPKNENGKVSNPLVIPVGKGIVGFVAEHKIPQIVPDISQDSRYILDDKLRGSELAVPIISDGELIGVIDSEHSQKDFFNSEHLETLMTVANLSATKIKNALIRNKQKYIDRERLESEKRLRSIIESSLDAIITIDIKGIVTEWNTQAHSLFGYSNEEAIGQRLSELIIPEEFRASHEMGMKHYRKTGEGPVLNKRIEIFAVNKDGKNFPIELSITPVEVKGEMFFSAFVRDITLKKKAEKDMEQALSKEKELNELKSKFVSLTSHEFRTPLTTIKSNVELLEYQLEKQGDFENSTMQRNFSRINSQINRLTELMNDVLIISKIESGKIPFSPTQTDMNFFIEELVQQNFSKNKDNRSLDLFLPMEKVCCELDHKIYMHVINNLISNAFKYSNGKGNPSLSMKHTENEIIIEVVDQGIGIPKEEQQKLFGSFFRASNVENIQGSGLGLSIVKEFLEMHNATIDVESEKGKGSKFIITQPKKLDLETVESN